MLGRVRAGWAAVLSTPAASADAGESAKNLSSERRQAQMKYSVMKQTDLVLAFGRVSLLNCNNSPRFWSVQVIFTVSGFWACSFWRIRCGICYL